MFLPMAAGREIYTVEALAVDGELSEAQAAMASGGGSQCGYCTPGFVVSLFAEQYRPDREGPCDTMALAGQSLPLHRLSTHPRRGTLARACAGRRVSSASRCSRRLLSRRSRQQDFRDRQRSTRASSLLRDDPRAKLVAGATDVGVESNLSGRRWPHLISLDAIDELREFSSTSERVMIGAALPLQRDWPALDRRARGISRVARALRVAADSQPRHNRRQSRHRLADR